MSHDWFSRDKWPYKQALGTHFLLWQLDSLGHNIRELRSRCDLRKDHVSIPDGLMGEVLANVNVLGSLMAADDAVSPLNAGRVVLIHSCRLQLSKSHATKKRTHVNDVLGDARHSHELRLG